jgi:hypothetical protein
MRVSANDKQPSQDACNNASSINTIENNAKNVEKDWNFKLVGNVVGNLNDILGPYPIIQGRLLTINLAGVYSLGFSRTENDKHPQGEKYLCQHRPKNMTRTHQ